MSTRIETDFTPYGWVDFEQVTCDLCDTTYPANGNLAESARLDAHQHGWQIDRLSGRACCPTCHLRAFNGEP